MSINNRGSNRITKVLSVRVSDGLLEQLDKYCVKEDRARTPAIRHFIRIALEEYDEPHRKEQMQPLRRSLVNTIEHCLNSGFDAIKELEPETASRMERSLRNIMDNMIDMLRESIQIEDVE